VSHGRMGLRYGPAQQHWFDAATGKRIEG